MFHGVMGMQSNDTHLFNYNKVVKYYITLFLLQNDYNSTIPEPTKCLTVENS